MLPGMQTKVKKVGTVEHIAVKSNIALDHVGSLEICSGFSICSLCLPQQPAAPRVCVRARETAKIGTSVFYYLIYLCT